VADDNEIVTWWGLVIEGYVATQEALMGEIAERFDLTPPTFDILLRLVRTPGHQMPMTRLATEAALSAGLIRRSPSPADRRVTFACLTEHGRDVAEKARHACAEILRRRVLDPLGPEGAASLAETMRALREVNAD
jgi:DNA-binding MarR family transcriptional regulator